MEVVVLYELLDFLVREGLRQFLRELLLLEPCQLADLFGEGGLPEPTPILNELGPLPLGLATVQLQLPAEQEVPGISPFVHFVQQFSPLHRYYIGMGQHPIQQCFQLPPRCEAPRLSKVVEPDHFRAHATPTFPISIVGLQLTQSFRKSSHKKLLMGGEQSNSFGTTFHAISDNLDFQEPLVGF